ncbi:MAG TPA: ATP-binding protein [bacterium]|nr:GAF domain-containing protein [Myxococcales bacterium]HQG13753.1 ATP-binding protein [bacterium]
MISRENLIDTFVPDYRRRHIFTTKLRILAFVGFWAFFLFFTRGILAQAIGAGLLILCCFFVTAIAYYNVIRDRFLISSFIAELMSDLVAITAVIYLTGGPHSSNFILYLFYAMTAGFIYNHYLAGLIAVFSGLTYGVFLLLCKFGVFPPLIYNYGGRLPIPTYTSAAHFTLLVIFMAAVIYTVKVSIFFSQQRERALEKRNRELTALHSVGAAVRSVAVISNVIHQLLAGVLQGLELESAILLHFDRKRDMIRLYTPGTHPRTAEISEILGASPDGMEFPLSELLENNQIMREISKHRIVFRREIHEIFGGFTSNLSPERCEKLQHLMGVRKMIALPLVLEGNVLGALIGFSKYPFFEDEQVATMESFANQAALSLEAAAMVDRLRRMNEDLKRANDVKSEFLATMSHELRTPLTAIIGFSELLMEEVMGELSEEQRDSVKEVLHNAADLLEMINSLLDLTKIESGRMELDITSFSIEETVRRVVATISPLIKRKSQLFELSIDPEIPIVKGDERKIQQVILNLMANANKFTPPKGWIRVEVTLENSNSDVFPKGNGNLRMRHGGDLVLFQVTDSGIGVPEDQHDKIFEMFRQADSSITRSFGGTGLGLSLARQFIEMHGGRIWVESHEENGASFKFFIPIERDSALQEGSPRPTL